MTFPPSSPLFHSAVEQSRDLITVFDAQGLIVYINPACREILGGAPDDYLGRCIVDFVPPDERLRAQLMLQTTAGHGAMPGITAFRLRRHDGTYLTVEMTVSDVTDGERRMLMTVCRRPEVRFVLEDTLHQLMRGAPLDEIMARVCDCFAWRLFGSGVAITWIDGAGFRQHVTTGLPDILCGDPRDAQSPWGRACANLQRMQETTLDALPAAVQEAARGAGFGSYWLEPIAGLRASACVTVWLASGGLIPPVVHAEGMKLAGSLLEVILRFTEARDQLHYAAHHDDLTQLHNRKAFFDAVRATPGGALLYCDLDRFKPVNDEYGHAIGDEVLQRVAGRLRGCVRDGDIVARLGGDEFGVLCPGCGADEAIALATRVRDRIAEPFVVGDVTVRVGISVGVTQTDSPLDAGAIAKADRALYAEKRRR